MKPDLATSERDPKSKYFFPAEPYAVLKAGNLQEREALWVVQ